MEQPEFVELRGAVEQPESWVLLAQVSVLSLPSVPFSS